MGKIMTFFLSQIEAVVHDAPVEPHGSLRDYRPIGQRDIFWVVEILEHRIAKLGKLQCRLECIGRFDNAARIVAEPVKDLRPVADGRIPARGV